MLVSSPNASMVVLSGWLYKKKRSPASTALTMLPNTKWNKRWFYMDRDFLFWKHSQYSTRFHCIHLEDIQSISKNKKRNSLNSPSRGNENYEHNVNQYTRREPSIAKTSTNSNPMKKKKNWNTVSGNKLIITIKPQPLQQRRQQQRQMESFGIDSSLSGSSSSHFLSSSPRYTKLCLRAISEDDCNKWMRAIQLQLDLRSGGTFLGPSPKRKSNIYDSGLPSPLKKNHSMRRISSDRMDKFEVMMKTLDRTMSELTLLSSSSSSSELQQIERKKLKTEEKENLRYSEQDCSNEYNDVDNDNEQLDEESFNEDEDVTVIEGDEIIFFDDPDRDQDLQHMQELEKTLYNLN